MWVEEDAKRNVWGKMHFIFCDYCHKNCGRSFKERESPTRVAPLHEMLGGDKFKLSLSVYCKEHNDLLEGTVGVKAEHEGSRREHLAPCHLVFSTPQSIVITKSKPLCTVLQNTLDTWKQL